MIYDVIVVGTGAGGATVARELSREGLNVLILEKGSINNSGSAANSIKTASFSLEMDSDKNDSSKNPSNYQSEGNGTNNKYEFLNQQGKLMFIEGIGGTTPVSLANACYACTSCYSNSPTAQFKIHDLELFEELLEASQDLNVGPLPREFTGPTTRMIWETAEKLGHFIEPMPKFIDYSKCNNCGQCIDGCDMSAKWDSNQFIKEAIKSNATLIPNFEVTRVIIEDGKCKGVEGIKKTERYGEINKNGKCDREEGISEDGLKETFFALRVVLAAGALNTPKILKNSKITANVGQGLFCDLFITVGGFLENNGLNREIPMGIKSEFGPFFISPHFSNYLVSLLKEKGFNARPEDVVGLMVKIADQANGNLNSDGTIYKPFKDTDQKLLIEGYEKSVEILTEMGVEPSSIVTTPIRGAHPGGTAAMGKVVDKSLETEISGLYLADASVIPQAPGRPPILTINALAKKLAKNLINDIKNK